MRADLNHRRVSAAVAALVGALTAHGIAQRADLLEPERSVSGTLAAGGRRAYEFSVQQGDFIRVVVEQDRMDLELRLARDANGSFALVQNAVREDDVLVLSAIAPRPGTYGLELIAGAGQRTLGRYRATLTTRRAARAGDERRVAADLAYAESIGLRGRGNAESMRLARDHLNAAMSAWRDLGDREDEGRALLQLTEVIFRLGDLREALAVSQQAVQLWRSVGDPSHTAAALNDVAVCLDNLGDPGGRWSATRKRCRWFGAQATAPAKAIC